MSLSVGTDAFWSLADVRAYWAARGETAWEVGNLPDVDAEVLIRKATDYINRKWDFVGDKATAAQRLKWPRKYAMVEGFTLDENVIPWQVQEATAIVADLLRQGTFDAEGIVTDDTAAIQKQRVDVVEVVYDTAKRLQGGAIASHVIELLRPVLRGQGGLVRA